MYTFGCMLTGTILAVVWGYTVPADRRDPKEEQSGQDTQHRTLAAATWAKQRRYAAQRNLFIDPQSEVRERQFG